MESRTLYFPRVGRRVDPVTGQSLCPFCAKSAATLWRTSSFELKECLTCGLHWAGVLGHFEQPLYPRDYYNQNYLGKESIFQRVFFHDQLLKIGGRVSGRHLLDVGFGGGLFLDEAQKQGWQVTGIESSQDALTYTQSSLKKPASLLLGDLQTINLPPKSFDVISFWDVLAHVSDPATYLRRSMDLLAPNGMLVIKTPLRSKEFFHRLAPWPAWISESLIHWPLQRFYFSQASLRQILESAGFNVETEVFSELPAQKLSWSHYCRHPKGAFLAVVQKVYTRWMATGSLLIRARRQTS